MPTIIYNRFLHARFICLCMSVLMFSCVGKVEKNVTEAHSDSTCFPPKTEEISSNPDGNFIAHKASSAIEIDGCGNDSIWKTSKWHSMNYIWMGEASVKPSDYFGKFKLAWDEYHLYILVEVTDDYLQATLADGNENYWKGDYVEVFIDEDMSGGDHKFNHQAFAYHISTEGHAIDQSTAQTMIFFDDHVTVERTQEGNTYLWELAVRLYDNTFDESSGDNVPVKISTGNRIGFSIAYGDNDGNQLREHFVGSKKTHGVNNDEGYINSSVFGTIVFND